MLDTGKEYVFMSYSQKDDIAPILAWFEDKGYNLVYDDDLHVGEVWDMKVRRYINSVKCKGVICVLSRASLSSRSVLKEMDYVKLFGRKSAAISLETNNGLASVHWMSLGDRSI